MINVETLHARMNAEGRGKMTWPTLSRTRDRLIMERPPRGSQSNFSQFMEKKLPEFRYDARRGWWKAPLTVSNYQRVTVMCRIRIHRHKWWETLYISDGVKAWFVSQEPLPQECPTCRGTGEIQRSPEPMVPQGNTTPCHDCGGEGVIRGEG